MTNDNSPVGDEYHSSEFESDKAASDVRRPPLVLLPEMSRNKATRFVVLVPFPVFGLPNSAERRPCDATFVETRPMPRDRVEKPGDGKKASNPQSLDPAVLEMCDGRNLSYISK